MMAGYRLLLASSVGKRDGMAVELIGADGECLAEVFKDDQTGGRTFTALGDRQVPIEAIKWLLNEAKNTL